MSLAAAVQGARRPAQLITWLTGEGAPFDLTGATISARIRNLASGQVRESDGAFVIVDPAAGVFRWEYSEGDVAEVGIFEVQFTATFATGASPARTLVSEWRVLRSL